jgi:hypothetical protein
MNVTISPQTIMPAADYAYLAQFTSDDPTRVNLHCIHVRRLDSGEILAVASDGVVLGSLAYSAGDPDIQLSVPAAYLGVTGVQRQLMQAAIKAARKDDSSMFVAQYQDRLAVGRAERDDDGKLIGVKVESVDPNAAAPDLEAPLDVRPLFRWAANARPADVCSYNAAILARFSRPKDKNGTFITFAPSAEAAAIVRTPDPRFVGLIMPVRASITYEELMASGEQLA